MGGERIQFPGEGRCPVTCGWHQAANRWLREGHMEEVRKHGMILYRAHLMQWGQCRCGLWDRVLQVLGP